MEDLLYPHYELIQAKIQSSNKLYILSILENNNNSLFNGGLIDEN